jgi:hypothetical protein
VAVRAQLVRWVTGAVALTLVAAGCSNDGSGDDGSDDGPTSSDSRPREAKPSDTTQPIKDAALAAGSVVVTRTVRSGKDITHEEIEVELTEPMSGRVLHVGEEIWTLDVVDGVGYLKDQTERKSTTRWTKLSGAETTQRLEDVTIDGLLGVLDTASKVTGTEKATVAGAPATCHTLTLAPGSGTDAGPVPQSARVCVDADRRPVELVVTADGAVTTSLFTGWGGAIEAMPPPPNLVDGQG